MVVFILIIAILLYTHFALLSILYTVSSTGLLDNTEYNLVFRHEPLNTIDFFYVFLYIHISVALPIERT